MIRAHCLHANEAIKLSPVVQRDEVEVGNLDWRPKLKQPGNIQLISETYSEEIKREITLNTYIVIRDQGICVVL